MKPFVWMKNALFVVLPLALLGFSGCTGGSETPFTPVLDDAYSTNATLQYGEDTQAKLLLTRYGEGTWEATFAEPPALAGVTLAFDGGAVSASYKGLAFTVPKTAMPAKSMLVLLTDVLDALDKETALPATLQDDQSWRISGESEGGSYTVTFDQGGKLQGFEIPSQPLSVTFSNYVTTALQTDATGSSSTSDTQSITTGPASSATGTGTTKQATEQKNGVSN